MEATRNLPRAATDRVSTAGSMDEMTRRGSALFLEQIDGPLHFRSSGRRRLGKGPAYRPSLKPGEVRIGTDDHFDALPLQAGRELPQGQAGRLRRKLHFRSPCP